MSIFHAYDIRGLYPEEITPEISKKIGAAVVAYTGAKEVVVGRDMRASSDILFPALCEGIASQGAKIIDIGMCATPLFYFGVNECKGAAGIMITASHNPAAFNGFKIMNIDGTPIGKGSGMEEIASLVIASPDFSGRSNPDEDIVTQQINVFNGYIKKLLDLVKPEDVAGLIVAIDAGNGMGGIIASELFKRLQCEMHPLYFEPDGTFPHHEANPIKHETLQDLKNMVLKTRADIGVAYDGDADRVGFLDETGTVIPGDIVTALLARELLKDTRDGLILYDVRSSWSVPRVVAEAGGKSEMTKVGHALIKQHMKKSNALFAGELSAHYYFSEFHRNEATEYALLILMRMCTREARPLSHIVAEIKKYFHSGEINFDVHTTQEILSKLKARYASTAVSIIEIDGLRMEFVDWWFNVRLSNTESKLRLNLEAKTQSVLKEKETELKEFLSEKSQ